jgi:hypothetical protein
VESKTIKLWEDKINDSQLTMGLMMSFRYNTKSMIHEIKNFINWTLWKSGEDFEGVPVLGGVEIDTSKTQLNEEGPLK